MYTLPDKNTKQRERSQRIREVRGVHAYQAGVNAEILVKNMLLENGWQILLERARTKRGEIDLVASKASILCFIEVKSRQTTSDALFALRPAQQKRLYKAAECLLAEHATWVYDEMRFDLVTIDAEGRITWLKDILRQM
ncbi:MAG: YraN family protein [Acetobacter sp.]|uniref:YraN family protein n=1 Tax=Acetobacter sp. TaxID=440 RepID=UPI003F9215E0